MNPENNNNNNNHPPRPDDDGQHRFLTIQKIEFTDPDLWKPEYRLHRGNLHQSTFHLGEKKEPNSTQTLYQMNFDRKANDSDESCPVVRCRNIDSKQRKNISLGLYRSLVTDNPSQVHPTYWTQYKTSHGRLGLTLLNPFGKSKMKKKPQKYNLFTGEEFPMEEEKTNFHFVSRNQILFQERKSKEKNNFLS